jgi:hypothetical protein
VAHRRILVGAGVILVFVIAGRSSNPGDDTADAARDHASAAAASSSTPGPTPATPASTPATHTKSPEAEQVSPSPSRRPGKPKPVSKPKPAPAPAPTRAGTALLTGVGVAALPDPRLTPGDSLPAGVAAICVPGYSARVRDVPESEKKAVYARYHVAHVPYAHEVDHLVSLELGGSNSISNLWPEPYAGRWGARAKDVLENKLHELVCDGTMSLRHAQRMEVTNWVSAYRTLIGAPPPALHHRAPAPLPKPARVHHPSWHRNCEPGYSPCLPVTHDLNCSDLSASQSPVTVSGDDPYGLDRDGDGTGCDS